jgi:hypothetical protein
MKRLPKEHRVMTNPHDFRLAGRHIHSLRIRGFASEGINFTDEENEHFEVCRVCRLNVLDALKNVARMVVHPMVKAA